MSLSDNRSSTPIFGLLFEWPIKTGFTVQALGGLFLPQDSHIYFYLLQLQVHNTKAYQDVLQILFHLTSLNLI